MTQHQPPRLKCVSCDDGYALDFDISMAFQPIVDMRDGRVFAYEALVRGADGAGADTILAQVNDDNIYAFDQQCRTVAIERAVAAGLLEDGARLSINFLPDAVHSPRTCIQSTLNTAALRHFPTDRLMFEFAENERMANADHISEIVGSYRDLGFTVALDDFGASHSDLSLLAKFQPDIIKLDMSLLRALDLSLPRRVIVEAMVLLCHRLDMAVIAVGIETRGELDAVRSLGIDLVQGYLLARPAFEKLPPVTWPDAGDERKYRSV